MKTLLKLLDAELAYRKEILWFILLSSAAVLGILALHSRTLDYPRNVGYLFMLYMFFGFVITVFFNPWSREHRTRRMMTLPLSVRTVALVKLAAEIIYWFLMVALFVVYSFFLDAFVIDREVLYALLTQTGVIFIGSSGISLFRELIYPLLPDKLDSPIARFAANLLQWLLPFQLLVLVMVHNVALVRCYENNRVDATYNLFTDGSGALLLGVPGILLLAATIILFQRRKTFVMN